MDNKIETMLNNEKTFFLLIKHRDGGLTVKRPVVKFIKNKETIVHVPVKITKNKEIVLKCFENHDLPRIEAQININL